ncbi:MAG TPA: hypothetical protein VF311_08795 [Terriglobales bacterium]
MDARIFARFHLDVGIADVVMQPLEAIRCRDWLEFAGVRSPLIRMIACEQQFAEKLHAYTLPHSPPIHPFPANPPRGGERLPLRPKRAALQAAPASAPDALLPDKFPISCLLLWSTFTPPLTLLVSSVVQKGGQSGCEADAQATFGLGSSGRPCAVEEETRKALKFT